MQWDELVEIAASAAREERQNYGGFYFQMDAALRALIAAGVTLRTDAGEIKPEEPPT